MAAKPLVIVESPAKAKTLGRFLGNKYRVEASYGHIRDLPESASDVPKEIKAKDWGRLGVDVEQDFTPYYVVPSDKRKQVAHLKTAVKEASELLLATDPDREGESISWHLTQVLKPRVPVRRIVFHEITEDAVKEALDNPSDVNENLVRAQESRRILDRLYGYTLSPVLWKKVQTGLSAGRVQSVAVRLIVEREEERRAFRSAEYWDLEASMKGEGREFVATLVRINDQRIATGKDFDAQTGVLKNQSVRLLDEPATQQLVEAVRANVPWTVTSVEQKPGVERPAPPFTTSTLTQEASRKLGFSTERTMQVAQRLFQGVDIGNGQMEGLITYHRTDSTTLSDKALNESARVIREMFGAEYYDGARRYATKVKNAQEAHEAIRPTDFRLAPSQLEGALDPDDLRIYELIWKRTMASQMVDARVLRTTLEISAQGPAGETAVFTASGKAIEFAGFRRAYVEGSDDPAAELEEQEAILPQCSVGDRIHRDSSTPITLLGAEPKRHETVPPARFTEASLIKALETLGIGRPSTYAPTIATIARRGYVFRQGKALVPSFTAFAVTKLLREHFGDFVETDFTAEMEEDLDEISRGERESIAFLKQFYYGDRKHRGLLRAVEHGAEKADYPVLDLGVDQESGEAVRVRIGRFGPFVQVAEGGPGRTASLPEDVAPADLTVDKALELVRAKAEGPRTLGVDPATGQNVYVMNGRYGAYVQLGETPEAKGKGQKAAKPKRASLQAGMTDSTVTLEEALKLLSLPRIVGIHPDDNEPISTNFGRFGPYVKHGDEFRSLESEEDVFNVSFDAALALLRAPKQSRRRPAAQKKVLRELTENGTTLKVLAGRYGPYVTDGATNASIPKTTAPEALTYAQAAELLAARKDAAPTARRARTRPRAVKATAATGRSRRKAVGA
ncbi:MAG TPA: type I DNA topoisomerase [Vicinamibacterales bacterium]|jgi:DNA topoisomerase-1|nr:type I DNA topoisomerase [Vicinamibacterales bacterium]